MGRRWLLLVILLSFAITGKKLAAQRNLPPTSIAFLQYYSDPGAFDLIVLNPESPEANPSTVASKIISDLPPRWKPQGGVLLFTSTQDNNQDIFTVRADGQKLTNLTKNPALDTTPVWSPDGKFIVFASDRDKEPGLTELYVMDANGSNVLRITRSGENGYASDPAWSPDGNTIVYLYHASKDAKPSLSTTNSTGTREAPFAPADSYVTAPAWSPDGKLLAIMRENGTDCELMIINADGTFPRPIAHFQRRAGKGNPQFESSACQFDWSANNFSLVYSAPNGDTNDIFVAEVSGEVRNLTNSTADEQMPSFSPDGSQVVFSSNQLGTYNLFRVKAEGTDLTRYTAVGYDSVAPVWGWAGPIEF